MAFGDSGIEGFFNTNESSQVRFVSSITVGAFVVVFLSNHHLGVVDGRTSSHEVFEGGKVTFHVFLGVPREVTNAVSSSEQVSDGDGTWVVEEKRAETFFIGVLGDSLHAMVFHHSLVDIRLSVFALLENAIKLVHDLDVAGRSSFL